jgi:hypothetical protein
MSAVRIIVSGCLVRLVGDAPRGVPRRQGFAWVATARDYAERLSAEHGWPIEERRGQR